MSKTAAKRVHHRRDGEAALCEQFKRHRRFVSATTKMLTTRVNALAEAVRQLRAERKLVK